MRESTKAKMRPHVVGLLCTITVAGVLFESAGAALTGVAGLIGFAVARTEARDE